MNWKAIALGGIIVLILIKDPQVLVSLAQGIANIFAKIGG